MDDERWPFEIVVEYEDGAGRQINVWNRESAELLLDVLSIHPHRQITLIDVAEFERGCNLENLI